MKEIIRYSLQLVRDRAVLANQDYSSYSPSQAISLCEELFNISCQPEEVSVLLCLDAKLQVAGAFEVSRGSLTTHLLHPREILKRALLCNAHAMIILHNHPSGDPEPSRGDILVTSKIRNAGSLVGIELLDHIVIGDVGKDSKCYHSMKARGTNLLGKKL